MGTTPTVPVVFPLAIDHVRSLAELVAAGNYDYVNPNITEENFPMVASEVVVQVALVHLDNIVESDDVLGELEQMGLRPGTMRELAHFGEQYPKVQRQFPVAALGSVWTAPNGSRRVGYLWEGIVSRKLSLGWYDLRWRASYRFLAFRK
ncbi:MAG TPA: hypothetical protein VIC06_02405 [Solirubrobacteraceae bacterium]